MGFALPVPDKIVIPSATFSLFVHGRSRYPLRKVGMGYIPRPALNLIHLQSKSRNAMEVSTTFHSVQFAIAFAPYVIAPYALFLQINVHVLFLFFESRVRSSHRCINLMAHQNLPVLVH